ncbi:MAG: CHASE2 domain-containing protein [Leptolyngbyaceae cyanobacterium MO_188.B28]|nr:CHASE2 domain-containing protein [Leptolyngbyaceae cyanobacterium MO_188.B28]
MDDILRPSSHENSLYEDKDVFISYSRRDKEFVQTLHEALVKSKYETWVDWEDIPKTSLWWEEIKEGIEAAHTFVFVISPDSVNSKYCNQEIDHAAKHNKRLIPIVCRDGFQTEHIHPAVSERNWLFFRELDDFESAFQSLVKVIDTDLDHAKDHARLLVRAIEWDREGRDNSFLLRDKALAVSEEWLRQSLEKVPGPTLLQAEYVSASSKLQQQTVQKLRKAVVYHQPKRRKVFLTSTVVTIMVLVLRFLGALQPLELAAFDWLMRLRPNEEIDDRLLIIEVTEKDLADQLKEPDKGGGTLSDTRLNRLLEKLEQHQPRLIGLDLYRDFDATLPELETRMAQNDNFYAVCKVNEVDGQGNAIANTGTNTPPKIPPKRVGFSDVEKDKDSAVRRHLMLQEQVPGSSCGSKYSLSLLLALRYLTLEKKGTIQFEDPLDLAENLRLEKTIFKRLDPFTGAYQLESYGGYQILLNYRAVNSNLSQAFKRISLGEVLDDKISEQDVRDRLVLIGITAKSSREIDDSDTPYAPDVPGIIIQAHMVSQIISAVLDERRLLWVWPWWGEILWIWGWSLVSSLFTRYSPRRRYFAFAVIIALGGLLISCFAFLMHTGWIPLVPSAISLVITGGSLIYVAFQPVLPQNSFVALEHKPSTSSSASPRR